MLGVEPRAAGRRAGPAAVGQLVCKVQVLIGAAFAAALEVAWEEIAAQTCNIGAILAATHKEIWAINLDRIYNFNRGHYMANNGAYLIYSFSTPLRLGWRSLRSALASI
jgi:hypothetical protein